MTRRRVVAGLAVAAVALGAVLLGPTALFPDAPAPSTIAPYVDAARADLASNINDFEPRPFHLRFLRALCRADGGTVLLFEQRMFPYVDVEYAYTMSGRWPPIPEGAGGAHLTQPYDAEIAAFLSDSAVECR